jgi:NAD(P)H-quinone oxidoreductase subunit 4
MKRRLAYSSVSHMGFVLLGIASFTDLGISGAVLQMISHGLIAAALFFLAGVTYDRTHTLKLEEMGGIGAVMPKVFTLFTIAALASLALPGMSGFASELEVFVGVATSDIYSSLFRSVTLFLAAVGLILTPIYLLNLLRQLFYATGEAAQCDLAPTCDISDGPVPLGRQEAVCFGTSCVLPDNAQYNDAKPREVFIAACFLLLVIGIGLYPKMATQLYDVKTVAVNSELRQAHAQIAQTNPHIYAEKPLAPAVAKLERMPILGVFK